MGERTSPDTEKLFDLCAVLAAAPTAAAVARAVADAGRELLGAATAAVGAVSGDDIELTLIVDAGAQPADAGQRGAIPLATRDPMTNVIEGRAPAFIEAPDAPVAPELPAGRAFACAPLEHEGRVIGALRFGFDEPRRFDDRDRRVLAALARQCAPALSRARKTDVERASCDDLKTLAGRAGANGLGALRTSEERLGMALAAARMIAWEWDAAANSVVHTENAAEILGLGAGSKIEKPAEFHALVQAEDRPIHAGLRTAIRRGETYHAKYRVVRPVDGGVIWIESVGRGVRDESGALVRALGVMMDITDRVRAEQERAAAELGSQLKDEFLARVSHELRTPLAAMRMWIQVLRSGASDDRRAAIEAIDKCARAQSKLIEDLLDLARGMNGKLRITEEIFDVRSPIEEAVAVMRPEAEGKQILLLTAVATDAGHVRGDSGRIQQVVANLLSNAVKFTPSGGRVEVLARRDDSAIVVSVSDTGPGIDPGEIDALFIPFRQREGAQDQGGLGLGLAIAKQLVELHNGTIRVAVRPEGGAVFTVTLPRVPEEELPPTPSQVRRESNAPPPLAGLRLLLVEDHGPTREGLARVLKTFGAEIAACGSSAEAMEAIRRARPDVIVSDLAMPEEDGCAFIGRVRALEGDVSRTPAVALTAHARPEDALRALTAGFQLHVAKPLDSHYLVDVISRLAGRAPAPTSGGRRNRRRAAWSS